MKEINWNDLSEMGLVFRINNEILHPLGLAVFYETTTGRSAGALVSEDGWTYSKSIMDKMSVKISAMAAYEEIQSEICDFFAGLGAPGAPDDFAEMQAQLQQRISALFERREYVPG